MVDYRSDVTVIGGGLAGICAVLELLDRGRTVVLFDRDTEEAFGGQAYESFGGIFAVGTPEQRRVGARDSPDLALADWHAFAEFDPDDIWPKRWAAAFVHRSLGDIYEWLRQHGIGFVPLPHWAERGHFTPGNSVPRFHIVWGSGRELVVQLTRRIEMHPQRHKLQLKFGHRVDVLTTSGGIVSGCRGTREAEDIPFEARSDAVLITAGGINGNLDLVRRHWHKDWSSPPETILNGAHRFADGRLHEAARAAGGNVTHLDKMWNYAAGVHHPRPRKPHHGLSLVPPRSALWMNWRGERIGPQPLVNGFDTRELVAQVCRQERQYSWQIMNRTIALKELGISGAEFNPSLRNKNRLTFARDMLLGNRWLLAAFTTEFKDVTTADTVPELTARMNRLQGENTIDAQTLEREILAYDERITRGDAFHNDEQLRRIASVRTYRGDRMRTCKAQRILDKKARPLIAVRQFILSRKSLGGIQTDLNGRVLSNSGEPIEGLYAAGEAAGFGGGGMHGLRSLEGTFLAGAIFSGRVAGRAIGGERNP
jgi:predicted oxidoreductase